MNTEELNNEAEVEVEAQLDEQAVYQKLKTAANRTSNWRERLEAVEALSQLEDNEQVIDVLKNRMQNDKVYQVQEAAYQALKKLGQDVEMPARTPFDLFKDLDKVLLRIKKSLPAGHSYEEFKEKLKKMRIDVYDTYEGDKGEEFDQWLEARWAKLRGRR